MPTANSTVRTEFGHNIEGTACELVWEREREENETQSESNCMAKGKGPVIYSWVWINNNTGFAFVTAYDMCSFRGINIAITNKIYLKFTFGHTFTPKPPLTIRFCSAHIFVFSESSIVIVSHLNVLYETSFYKRYCERNVENFNTLTIVMPFLLHSKCIFYTFYQSIINLQMTTLCFLCFFFMSYIHIFLKLICIHLNWV